MKKIILMVLMLIIVSAVATADTTVFVDDTQLKFNDQAPTIIDNRVLVPMRSIFEALGTKVDWDQNTQTVTATKGSDTYALKIGSKDLLKNGKKVYEMDVLARILNGRTLIPIRAISESLGNNVFWNQLSKSIFINRYIKEPKIIKDTPKEDNNIAIDFYAKQSKGGFNKEINNTKYIIKTEEELQMFNTMYSGANISNTYDLSNNTIFIQTQVCTSGSIKVEAESVKITDTVELNTKVDTPEGVMTCDMAYWYIVAVIPNNKLVGVNTDEWSSPTDINNKDIVSPTVCNSFSFMKYMPKDSNYMISPFSLKMAMMMLANGAEGETKNEILKTFGIEDINQYNDYAKKIIEEYNNNEDVELNIANSIWLNETVAGPVTFASSYKDVISNFYKGTATTAKASDIGKLINNFISEKTNGKITNVLSEQPATFLAALVNTMYFKGNWAEQFNVESTKEDTFTDRAGNKTQIDFMNNTDTFGYYEGEDMQMVRLYYKGYDTAMYIAIPKTSSELDFDNAIKNIKSQKIKLSIPKFKSEFDKSFKDVFENMGITEAFNENNTDIMNKMFENAINRIYIGDVLHKTFIEVDENGTEAAAATVVIAKLTSVMNPEEPKVFKADKPFIYFIRDEVSGEILFLGEYAFAK